MTGYDIQLNSAAYPLVFPMVLASDGASPAVGLHPTVVISKNGGAFGTPSGTVTEVGNGWYMVAGNATDANTLGPLALHATAATANPANTCYSVVAYNPHGIPAFKINSPNGFTFRLLSAHDHKSPVTGVHVTSYVSKAGAPYFLTSGTVTEIGNGDYYFNGSASDFNATSLVFRFLAIGADLAERGVNTQS